LRGHPTVGEMKIDRDGGARRGGMDQRLSGPIGDPDESALERPFGVSKVGKPPQGRQSLPAALDTIREQPAL
jgi:hypothetical protein